MGKKADYEGRVIRSVVLYPDDNLMHFIHRLNEKDFSSPLYRDVYRLIDELARKKDHVDSTDVVDVLEEAGIPIDTIMDCWSSHYTRDQIDEPINTIKMRTRMAEMHKLHEKWAEETSKTELKVDKHITEVMSSLYSMRIEDDDVTGKGMKQKIYDQWERYAGKDRYGIELGLEKLDFITMGCQPQHLWLVGGYTSVGKSWIGARIVNAHINQNVPTLWLSFEMSGEELWWRLAVQATGRMNITLNNAKQKNLSGEEMMLFEHTLDELSKKPIYTIDHLSTWEETRLAINYYIYSHGVKCIVLDYIQNITNDQAKSEYESLNRIIREMQKIAVKNDVFCCVFTQMNRESVRDDEDYVFGFKGSGNLENAADIAMVMKVGSSERGDPRRKIIIGKNRSGETGEVFLHTNYAYGYIEETTEEAWNNYQKS